MLAIERARRYAAAAGEDPQETVRRIVADIHGYELNPVSAQAARENYAAALGESQPEIPVRCFDAILHPPEGERFDYVAGNPPWVRWDYLPKQYREATLPLWKRYGLFSLNGFQARLGHGKKDLSMLFTYAAADHYLKDGGTLAFVITQEVFKSKGAGEGFRRFRLGEEGPPLQVRSVHDFVKLRPFGGTSNKTAAVVLTKGAATTYPLPYYVWDRDPEGALRKEELQARPMVSACGPWRTSRMAAAGWRGPIPTKPCWAPTPIPTAYSGWKSKRPAEDGLAAVRNLPEMGKKQIPPVKARIEHELIFPAVRGADIRRWGARPGVHVLVVQDPATRRGYPEAVMQQRWPRAFAYLEQFREELLRRALYRKYHQEAGHPFYSQFNIAPQTFAPFKVVWKRMAADLAAAVVSEWDGPLGRKPLLPLETTAFIGTQDPMEAHYLCAIMNSEPVGSFVKSFSSAGRGFGTPYVASRIRIPLFNPADQGHRRLAELSQTLHGGADLEGEKEIDAAVLSL